MHDDFKHRVAVVTGASSGIGLAVTQALLDRGANVLAMSRKRGGLDALHAQHSDRLHWIHGDVTNRHDLDTLANRAAKLGKVDFLVPNAGIAQLADGLEGAAFAAQWAVNGEGALNTLSAMRDRLSSSASVVFTGTFLSQVTFPGLAAYIATKAALTAHARTLAVELAPAGIRINVVSPGPTATPIWSTLGLADDQLANVAGQVNQRLLPGQFLEPSAIADAIVFLLSPAARGIFGQDLVVDHGYTVH